MAAAIATLVSACTIFRPSPPPVVGGRQEGIASWYGPGFHGRRTANGEIYDQYELTAAHPSLPLGSRVMVTSLVNGRSVEVRINDRGPFVGGRVIDLSYASARVLGMIGPGTMPVRIDLLEPTTVMASRTETGVAANAEPPPPAAAPERAPVAPTPAAPAPRAEPPSARYGVLVATLSDAGRAEHLRSRIALRFPEAYVSPVDAGVDRYYRVGIGPYALRGVALARAELVNRLGYPAVITEESAN
jgi:peptidoglycan lytic transglycosylase